MKTAFIFDLDGTLAESYQSLAASVEYVEQRAAEARAAMRGGADAPEAPKPKARRPMAWPFSKDGRISDPMLKKFEVSLRIGADLANEVYSLFSQLRERGCKLAVASDRPQKLTEALLKRLGLDIFVDGVYGPDTVGAAKPHPAMIHRAIADLGVRPGDVLFVGDEVVDIEMAHAAGVQIAAVLGAAGRTQCVRESPDFLVHGWPQVIALVDA